MPALLHFDFRNWEVLRKTMKVEFLRRVIPPADLFKRGGSRVSKERIKLEYLALLRGLRSVLHMPISWLCCFTPELSGYLRHQQRSTLKFPCTELRGPRSRPIAGPTWIDNALTDHKEGRGGASVSAIRDRICICPIIDILLYGSLSCSANLDCCEWSDSRVPSARCRRSRCQIWFRRRIQSAARCVAAQFLAVCHSPSGKCKHQAAGNRSCQNCLGCQCLGG